MDEKSQFVVIGKIVDTYGLKGYIKVEPYLEPKHWKKLKVVFLKKKGGDYLPFTLEDVKRHGRYVLVKFSNCEDVESARRYVSAKVFLPTHQLPKTGKEEYYYFELEGMEVYTQSGKFLGKITGILETQPYNLLELDEGRGYIPFTQAMVKKVDKENKKIEVSDLLSELY
ncbi:ribosome maturation factor RimM [Hydrogenobacter hydrogenophilus]|uniref:Ribosome maturation factor RimM n=1 Tax=Hydrogenobacter hydrogenophilus TaxID=35835 RepID=A0A285P4A9_9AQUI|nr:ribosome maturation factor RimM [Hydrogenobacter hydrogenophilus]SNZ16107.1 16S rRNA processing protein RimM [Hydrogenobacter hydrogenophilus]